MGAVLAGLVILSIFILPVILVIILAVLLYYLLKKRSWKSKKVSPNGREETLTQSSYTVLDEEEKDTP